MKKILLWACVSPLMLVMLSGCEKNDEESTYDVEISDVTNVKGSYTAASEIRAVASSLNQKLASCTVKNYGMVIKLPGKIASKYLTYIRDDYPAEYFEVSDPTAVWTVVDFYGYDSGGTRTGSFFKGSGTSTTSQFIYYCYVDKPVTVVSEDLYGADDEGNEIEIIVDFSLKQGWNAIYQKRYYASEDADNYYRIETKSSYVTGGYWFYYEE